MKCRLKIKVVPGSSKTQIVGWLGDCLKIKVAAPPEKGKANQAVIKLLCKRLQLSQESIEIVRGSTSPLKVLQITGITAQQLRGALPQRSA